MVTAKCEPSLKDARSRKLRYQFERLAYFALDKDSAPGKLVLQPHDNAEGHLGEGSAEKLNRQP